MCLTHGCLRAVVGEYVILVCLFVLDLSGRDCCGFVVANTFV